jgi:hypothetical protein
MKKILFLSLLVLALALPMHAQTISIPPASSTTAPGVPLTWTLAVATPPYVACTASSCSYVLYRAPGTCASNPFTGATWTVLASPTAGTLAFSDTTATPGSVYSWVVEAIEVGSGTNSGPSNCVTETVPSVPLVPAPPVLTGL